MLDIASHSGPLLEVSNLSVFFPGARPGPFSFKPSMIHAVQDISLTVGRGETLGIVGESGSGKTTLGRAILSRAPVSEGRVVFDNADVTNLKGAARRALQRHMQLVFQDPYSSLNPKMTAGDLIAEPLIVNRIETSKRAVTDRVVDLLRMVGLPEDAFGRYPHSFSGGQRQRIGIARALAMSPKFIVADEPVSALDVSVRAQVINILMDLQARLGLACLFIAHDIAVVRHISQRIAVMYAGSIVEMGDSTSICTTPRHPYTRSLIEAVLEPSPTARVGYRNATSLKAAEVVKKVAGCSFRNRCQLAGPRCDVERPILRQLPSGQSVACHFA